MLKLAAMDLLVRDRQVCRVAAIALCALALAWCRPAGAQQPALPAPTSPPAQPLILVPPPAAIQFQQSVQQQQLRDQLQQRQLESDLHRGVSEQAKRALGSASPNRAQLDMAGQAQRARDQAAQQALVDQYWGTANLPPPASVVPAKARSGG